MVLALLYYVCTLSDFDPRRWFSGFDSSADFVQVMDVGQGDSILIYSNGYSAVIDTGLPSSPDEICPDLEDAFIRNIDALVISHLHSDHAGGLPGIAERFQIENLITPKPNPKAESNDTVERVKKDVLSQNGKVYTATQGMNFKIGEFELTVLGAYDALSGDNNKSSFIMAELGGVKFLFTGDAEKKAENALLDDGIAIECDVLKVGHHGSDSSCGNAFLQAASPQYAVISVGEGNMYGHPDAGTVSALQNVGAEIYRTDESGDVFFYVENGAVRVETEK